MSKILDTISAIGALAMAVTPLIAIGGVAHAQTDMRPAHILVADLNLGRPADAMTFRRRVDAAAEPFCSARSERGLSDVDTCRDAFREEAVERLGDQQRRDLRDAEAASHASWALAFR